MSSDESKPKKQGLWAMLTCRTCQTEEYGQFDGIDDSVHMILKSDDKEQSNKASRLEEINRKAKAEQEQQKLKSSRKEPDYQEEGART